MKKMWRDVPIAVAVAMCFFPSVLLAAPASAPAPQPAVSAAPASSAVVASAPQVPVIKDCDVCPELVTIPSGSFMMGAEPNSYGYVLNQRPAHKVEVQKFLLGRTEVTQGQYRTLMGTNPSYFDSCGDNCPMEFVSWDEARDYINKLSEKTGKKYRLPSEAEWEYAARGGKQTVFWWGDVADHAYANYGKDPCCGGLAQGADKWVSTGPVAQLPPNPFGLHDMQGNVAELVFDTWIEDHTGAPTDGSGRTGGRGAVRVVKGGSYDSSGTGIVPAVRAPVTRAWKSSFIGFRVARSLP